MAYLDELKNAILSESQKAGFNPLDIATIFSYETAGTLNPWQKGPVTQWGQHRGLIQWGEPQAAKYGVGPDTPVHEQVAKAMQFLRDHGARPGMPLENIYAAINAGDARRVNASDANNGGAPGTVSEKVATQFSGHRAKAAALLGMAAEAGLLDGLYKGEIGKPSAGIPPKDIEKADAIRQETFLDALLKGQKADQEPTMVGAKELPEPIAGPIAGPIADQQGSFLDSLIGGVRSALRARGEELAASAGPVTQEVIQAELENQALEQFAKDRGLVPQTPVADLINELESQLKSGVAGIYDLATALPWEIGAGAVAPAEWAGRGIGGWIYGDEARPNEEIPSLTDWMLEQGQKGRAMSDTAAGIEPWTPPSRGQDVMRVAPMAATPSVSMNMLIPAILEYGPDIAEGLFGSAEAQSTSEAVGEVTPAPAGTDQQTWNLLGPLGIMTFGLLATPYGARLIRSLPKSGPKISTVIDGPSGNVGMARYGDVLQTMFVDTWSGVFNLARKAGIDPKAVAKVELNARNETHANASATIESSINQGRMKTSFDDFNVTTPLATLKKVTDADPMAVEYLRLHETVDELIATGRQQVRGVTYTDAVSRLTQMETQNPALKDVHKAYQQNLAEMRRFLSSGRFATEDAATVASLNATAPSEIPVTNRSVDTAPTALPNPVDALVNWWNLAARSRMKNETVGQFIRMTQQHTDPKIAKGWFREVTPDEVKANQHWKPNLVSFWEHGKKHTFYTEPYMADMLRIDPYYIESGLQMGLFGIKRFFETMTTGVGNPGFAVTSFIRNWGIGNFTTPSRTSMGTKLRHAGLVRSVYAIPQQLGAQAAHALATSMEASLMRGSGGMWGYLPEAFRRNAAKTLADQWHRSWMALLEEQGPHAGTFLQSQAKARLAKLEEGYRNAPAWARGFVRGWVNTLYAVHGAPHFAFAVKNLPKVSAAEVPEVIAIGRNLTGDPRAGGQAYIRDGYGGRSRQIRGPGGVAKTAAAGISEFGRVAIPWNNAIIQGIKAVGKAWFENPVKFTANVWAKAVMPSMALYIYSKRLGYDPNGVSYTDYAENGRSDYQKLMYYYIPIPGLPAEDGIEVPTFQEISIAKRMAESLIHHAIGRPDEAVFGQGEELMQIANTWVGNAIVPPIPPAASAIIAAAGMNPPQTWFEQGYQKYEEPFDQNSPLGHRMELLLRAIGGAAGQAFSDGVISFAETEEGFGTKMRNMVKSMGEEYVGRTPIVRDILGYQAPMSRSTTIGNELAKKNDALKALDQWWTKYGKFYAEGSAPEINLKGASNSGEAVVDEAIGDLGRLGQEPGDMSAPYPGMVQPEPNNPLFIAFAQELQKRLLTDNSSEDLKGFVSLTRRRGNMLAALQSMRNVSDGNQSKWESKIQDPEYDAMLQGLSPEDRKSPRRVKNYLTRQLNEIEKQILLVIRATEQDMSTAAGRPVRLEDIKPYIGPQFMQ